MKPTHKGKDKTPERKPPSANLLRALARFYEVPVEFDAKATELKAAFEELVAFTRHPEAHQEMIAASENERRKILISEHEDLLDRWRLRSGSLLSAINPQRSFVAQLFKLLASYAVRLEMECDFLRGKLEGNYWGNLPHERQRARLRRSSTKLKPKWSKQFTPKEAAERRKRSKKWHDRLRATTFGPGGIEEELLRRSNALVSLSSFGRAPEPQPQLGCLDDLLAGRSVGQRDLGDLLGCRVDHFRKIRCEGKEKRRREVFYNYRAFFQIVEHLLIRGTFLPDRTLRQLFLDSLERRLKDGQCPTTVSKVGANFVATARLRIRESAAHPASIP